MTKGFEKKVLRILFVFGIATFINLVRKPPQKDWLIIFLLKATLLQYWIMF